MDLQLEDRVIIVTGGTSGIGLAIVSQLASEGARVVAVARAQPENELPDGVALVRADLREQRAARHVAEATLKRFERIDGLVNNAAALTPSASFGTISEQQWADTFGLNLFAGIRLVNATVPALRNAEAGGAIVHIASEAARLPDPTIADYAAAKAALLSVSKSLAIQHGGVIRSNVVSPGPTRTPLFDAPGGFGERLADRFDLPVETAINHFVRAERRLPSGRIGQPEDVARPVCLLLSPLSRQVTGAEWAVDGGALRQL